MKDLISVIIPVYNVEEYLVECINSVLAQTYTNLEIILVNDGSTDSSGEICREYAKKDNRIILIEKENGGLSDARNAGLDVCTGKYISFVDSDDIIHPGFISLLYKYISYDTIVACDRFNIKDSSEITYIDTENTKVFNYTNEDILHDFYSFKITYPSVCNKLFPYSVFKKLRFPKGLIYEDSYIFPYIYTNKYLNFIKLNLPLYYYRYNPNSITRKKLTEKNYIANEICYANTSSIFQNNKTLYKKNISARNNFRIRYFLESIIDYSKFNQNDIKSILLDSGVHWKTKFIFIYKFLRKRYTF
ncbi:hypothetical protein MSHRCOH1_08710 [Candidatus Ornithobacterium hominis]|nr:hypothetical protein MSHRCOH1_08710 [Candidatus Ornithobacterium hominis]